MIKRVIVLISYLFSAVSSAIQNPLDAQGGLNNFADSRVRKTYFIFDIILAFLVGPDVDFMLLKGVSVLNRVRQQVLRP